MKTIVEASGFLVFRAMAGQPMISLQLGADGSPNVDTGPNVHIKIPVALNLDPRAVHISAPGLGIEDAELQEVARAGIVYAENSHVASHFVATGLRFETQPHLNFFAIVTGLVILVISEVFRTGTRLDEDQSLTV